MAGIDATDDTFEAEVLRADKPVLVDFWATWCGPCRQLAPIVEEIAEEYASVVKVVSIDVDACPRTAGMFRIQSIPTLVLFDEGKPVSGVQGAQPKDILIEFLAHHIPGIGPDSISAKDLEAIMGTPDVDVFDLRTPGDFARSHLLGSRVVPEIELQTVIEATTATTVVLTCRTGQDARRALESLDIPGKSLRFLDGGVLGWEGDGKPTFSTEEEAALLKDNPEA